jgi:hypothetical protein
VGPRVSRGDHSDVNVEKTMGPITDSIPNYQDVLNDARRMAVSGSTPSEILRYLAVDKSISGAAQLMVIFCRGLDFELRIASCIGGWSYDGSGELKDTQINNFLAQGLSRYVQSCRKS